MVPQTKVFVGSLPQGSKPEELRKLFERFGAVTECDIMNRCGFVHMQTEEQASAAIRALNNSSFNGGVISVERGRIKERGQRSGPGGGGRGGGMRGGMRGGMDRRGGGPMRGGPPPRDSPYSRDRPSHPRGPPPGAPPQMAPRPLPYERAERPPPPAYDDRYNGYGGEDRRGFALMERGARDPYASAAPMYAEERRYDELPPMYADDRRAPMYADERDMMDRRAPMRAAPQQMPYERSMPPRPQQMPNGDMFSRRSPINHGVPPLHQLLMTLRFYALGTMLISVADFVGVSKSTAGRIVRDISSAIATLYDEYIFMNHGAAEKFYEIAEFPRVVGAIDCTHIRIQSPCLLIGEEFRNRKGYFSLNVQGVCDADLRLTNVVARWPGSTHDATIFNNSILRAQCDAGHLNGRWLLGDSAYPNRRYLLTPLLNPRTEAEQRYNEAHIRTRNTIERRGAAPGGYDRDPYAQQYPPMGRGGGAARGRDLGGMGGPRRY